LFCAELITRRASKSLKNRAIDGSTATKAKAPPALNQKANADIALLDPGL
jgi:hypothetical protein